MTGVRVSVDYKRVTLPGSRPKTGKTRCLLVSAHSKGFSEMGMREDGEACVYPRDMIYETEIKSREKFSGLYFVLD